MLRKQRHRGSELAEDDMHDLLDVALIEMRILRRDALHELGFDHRCLVSLCAAVNFAMQGCQRDNGLVNCPPFPIFDDRRIIWQPRSSRRSGVAVRLHV
jgi:hypothetical protein